MSKVADALRRTLKCLEIAVRANGGDPDNHEAIIDARAALAADGWQPIETAPRDGTEVWVFVAPRDGLRGFQCVCAYHPDAGWCADELREVTHWQPLPAPPQEKP